MRNLFFLLATTIFSPLWKGNYPLVACHLDVYSQGRTRFPMAVITSFISRLIKNWRLCKVLLKAKHRSLIEEINCKCHFYTHTHMHVHIKEMKWVLRLHLLMCKQLSMVYIKPEPSHPRTEFVVQSQNNWSMANPKV